VPTPRKKRECRVSAEMGRLSVLKRVGVCQIFPHAKVFSVHEIIYAWTRSYFIVGVLRRGAGVVPLKLARYVIGTKGLFNYLTGVGLDKIGISRTR
jgi:hypothetical protein